MGSRASERYCALFPVFINNMHQSENFATYPEIGRLQASIAF